ncbi:hypothetical protein KIW84_010105 [Lathyrus oleraceus]|uniref:Peroxisomal membrane protein PEX14 central plants domain-containing protein n=1 Tax=Pisum sativum TaxID=3888 RepID=A0A9D5BB34_PEA|nr:hypothetical protein KIW84_010105 [Pisum sativum]
MLASKGEERKYFMEVVSLLDKQVQEIKLMTNAIRILEGKEDPRVSQTSSKRLVANGKADYDLHSGRSLSSLAYVEPSASVSKFMSGGSRSSIDSVLAVVLIFFIAIKAQKGGRLGVPELLIQLQGLLI